MSVYVQHRTPVGMNRPGMECVCKASVLWASTALRKLVPLRYCPWKERLLVGGGGAFNLEIFSIVSGMGSGASWGEVLLQL